MIKIIDCNLFECGAEVICHQVNCKDNMDNGIAKQVKERFPRVYGAYKKMCGDADNSREVLLGKISDVAVSDDKNALIVCSLFGQDTYAGSGFAFADYQALRTCLEQVRDKYKTKKIAIPYRMSCSLAGGDWRIVEEIILDVFKDTEITVCRFS